MYTQSSINSSAGSTHGSKQYYLIGFVLSLVLTIIPFGLVMFPTLPRQITAWAVILSAVVQVFVHLKYFLHLDTATEQRWNLIAFVFSLIIILLLVGLSLWIMESIHINMLAH
ncbi:cytochrome o ubiquinol oxidase subunit IV [Pseudomonas vanderleydeniana]|uniref:Cytochrome bo(3) ubiquinol oxidase subunit 4 n=1 Tax=Pseudomonas vanderleydeniana TaxID=2745495 RepID=A0A9E6PGP3_9PSED|nr:cytochrome o ubiquinol oxidase subunit IV [Pseudomonas vanderleydeniana]QXI26329.1 cytochrome o ubiquinol oxidase subunit IV [Pseudomonas vanderleydeniana]